MSSEFMHFIQKAAKLGVSDARMATTIMVSKPTIVRWRIGKVTPHHITQEWARKALTPLLDDACAGPLEDAKLRVFSLAAYVDNWDGDGAPAPNVATVRSATELLEWGREHHLLPDIISPDVEGGLALYYGRPRDGLYVWLSCTNDGEITKLEVDRRTDPHALKAYEKQDASTLASVEAFLRT